MNMLRIWILHFAFIVAVPLYFVVYQFALLPAQMKQTFPVPGVMGPMTYPFFLLLALAGVVGAWLIPGIAKQSAPYPEDDAATLLNKRVQGCVMQDAFLEATAVYGLIGVFIGLNQWQSYSLMAFALTMLLLFSLRLLKWGEEINYRASSRPTGLAGR